MHRNGVSKAVAAGLLVVGILIGAACVYFASTYQTKIVTQTETATTKLTSTVTLTVPPTMTDTIVMLDKTTLATTVTTVSTFEISFVTTEIVYPLSTTETSLTGVVGPPIDVTMFPTPSGNVATLREITAHPIPVSFTAMPPGTPPFTYSWDFGDGTGSSGSTVTHVFPTGCVYDVRLKVVDSLGNVTSGTILLGLFTSKGTTGSMVVCPQSGTAGTTNVELAGGFYGANESLRMLLDNSSLTNVTADSLGDWVLNITGSLTPQVNGSVYTFTSLPSSDSRSFLTLEGIRASPAWGGPGQYFTLEGRSYPANTTVSIYLAGVLLGQAKSDEHGSFLTWLQIPASLGHPGTYQLTTSPPVLGASATLTIVPLTTITTTTIFPVTTVT
jgi:hypothetical protein